MNTNGLCETKTTWCNSENLPKEDKNFTTFSESRWASISSKNTTGDSFTLLSAKNNARFAIEDSPDDKESVPTENFFVGGVAL